MKNSLFNKELDTRAIKQLKENSNILFLLGISLTVIGSLAVIFAYASTLFSVVYLGILLIIVGFIEGFQSFKLHKWGNFFLHFFLGILYIIAGFFIISNPTINAITLTLFLAIFFVVSGIAKIIFSFSKQVPHKGWLALNGVLTTILGILIWSQWPFSGFWVIGVFVGIDTIFTGWTLIMLSLAAKNMKGN